MEQQMSNVTAIKTYFESGSYDRKVELSELKALTPNDRAELGALCIKQLSEDNETVG